jgi:hypothetical protein
MHTVSFDLETRSAINLRENGAFIYAIDPTTQILCLVYAVDDGEPQLWLPGNVLRGENTANPPPAIFSAIADDPDDYELASHNYDFERQIYNHKLVAQYGFPPIPLKAHHCTLRLALANGYPAES